MEEDIKILNNFIKMDFKNPMGWTGYYDSELEELRQVIQNLLANYKQLEEENKNYKKYAVIMTAEGLTINGVKFNFNDYIPKSKVKEILEKEELPLVIVGGRRNGKTLEYGRKLGRIETCKELLGEE